MKWVLCSKDTSILPYLLFNVHHCAPTSTGFAVALSGEVVLNGVASCRTARSNVELAVNGADMSMHGARTDNQLLGYLDVGQASRHQAQHLYLPCRQSIRIGW